MRNQSGPKSADIDGSDAASRVATPRVVRDCALDWIKFDAGLARNGNVDPVEKALYAALASFVDKDTRDTDEDEEGPTRKVLAACIGRSVDTVDRNIKRLEERGLIDVERRKDPDNPRRNIPSIYRLLDHEIWDEKAAERAARRKAAREERRKKQQVKPPEGPGRTGAARGAAPVRPGEPHERGQGSRTGAAVPYSSSEQYQNSLSDAREGVPTPQAAAATEARENESLERSEQATEPLEAVCGAYRSAYAELHGTEPSVHVVRRDAAPLLERGWPLQHLVKLAAELPGKGYSSLAKHAQHNPPPARARTPLAPPCSDHFGPELNLRYRENAEGALYRCPECHPLAMSEARLSATHLPVD